MTISIQDGSAAPDFPIEEEAEEAEEAEEEEEEEEGDHLRDYLRPQEVEIQMTETMARS